MKPSEKKFIRYLVSVNNAMGNISFYEAIWPERLSRAMHYGIEYSYCATVRHVEERKGGEKKKRKKNHVVRFSPREACKQRVFRYVFFVSDILHTYIRLSALLTTTYDYLRLLRVRATINAGLFRIRRHATFLACNRRSGWPWNYLGPTLSILRM